MFVALVILSFMIIPMTSNILGTITNMAVVRKTLFDMLNDLAMPFKKPARSTTIAG